MTRLLPCLALLFAPAACSPPPRGVCDVPDLVCAATQRPWTQPLPIPPTYVPGTNAAYPGADYCEVHVTRFRQWFLEHEDNGMMRPYQVVP